MHTKYTPALKLELVGQYTKGNLVSSICSKYSIPRSTMYYWLNRYKLIKRAANDVITVNDVYLLKKHLKKIEVENQILKECGCTANDSRRIRLKAIAKLDGKYSIHALCRALDILRSTYYHYKLRRPEKTMIEKTMKYSNPLLRTYLTQRKVA